MTDNLPDRKCRKCRSTKPITEFPHNKHGPDGVDKMCKACWKARSKKTFKGSGRTKPVVAAAVIVPDTNVPVHTVKRLSELPSTPMWGWDGEFNEGLESFVLKTSTQPTIVYRFGGTNKFFTPMPEKKEI